ncbi:hypothetical protein [Flavobacterium sp. H4147]|uniref:hypothetical protein n=1 Tax=Flavobacterium sp. H4147 TaxID=3034149 RepID=UPI0023EC5074|nr:hypothetical protein [Flavobacterium sp. H4147]
MKLLKPFSYLGIMLITSCVGNMNPTGGNSTPDYPYYIATEPLTIKKIAVPKGTKLIYVETLFKKGKQDKMLSEEKLKEIELPEGQTIIWGGVPVTSIDKFFNSEMRGFTVYAKFDDLTEDKKTKFSELWQNCNNSIGITIKNTNDWSFNLDNIADVESCSVNYQRYFKDDANQQAFLDEMLTELRKIKSK